MGIQRLCILRVLSNSFLIGRWFVAWFWIARRLCRHDVNRHCACTSWNKNNHNITQQWRLTMKRKSFLISRQRMWISTYMWMQCKAKIILKEFGTRICSLLLLLLFNIPEWHDNGHQVISTHVWKQFYTKQNKLLR